jgi:RsfA family transcription factor
MSETRQDAWSAEEDLILAETVLNYIKDGKTQMEAFRDVAEQLSRTPAACGFRWNATIRKDYHEAIAAAKAERKKGVRKDRQVQVSNDPNTATIDSAIGLLERMKNNLEPEIEENYHITLVRLREENEQLKHRLQRYEKTVEEMLDLWSWINKKNT